MELVGFEMTSIEMTSIEITSTQPLTDRNDFLPLWAMGEEQEGHQDRKPSFTKAVVEGSSQGAATHLCVEDC